MGQNIKIKSFLPQREIDIGLRVRDVRLSYKWSQPDFAMALGIGRERLSSYEYAKAPIRVQIAAKLFEKFKVNARWLATGDGEAYCPFTLLVHPLALSGLPPRMLFSEAYDKHFLPEIEKRAALRKDAKAKGMEILFPVPIGAPRKEEFLWEIGDTIKHDVQYVPDAALGTYAQHLYAASAQFLLTHQATAKQKARKKGA